MSRDVTATPVGQRPVTGRQQASLRDHLNERVAPYLKKALIEGLNHDVEYPLQWLGEHLIHLSMIYEENPDSTNIKAHFKYNHDAPPPPPPPAPAPTEIKTEEQPRENTEMTNGVTSVESTPQYVNGGTFPEPNTAPVAAAPVPAVHAPAQATPPETTDAAPAQEEDTHMQGIS